MDQIAKENLEFKQSLSTRDKELNRLKANFDRQTQKRNNWLKEQSSRESRHKFYIKTISSSTSDIVNNVSDCNLEDKIEQFNTNRSKQTDENLYKTKYNWQPVIDNKTKIFTTRMYYDTTRARVFKRIRDKREARGRENRIIKRTTQRIQEFGREANRLKGSIQRTNSNTTRISKFISGFRRKIDILRELSCDIISRVGWIKREVGNLLSLKPKKSQDISKGRDISDIGFG
ncbi:hypothetical protein [Campylobacter sp. RM16187]|uniref:hypothetical protein n=1 Tax=Campylobacter sp. RM16187 TaxID=1660063 RepID=UPI0021B5C6BE|nr:hypothetical protein [Campylobacter sp. RM16187]